MTDKKPKYKKHKRPKLVRDDSKGKIVVAIVRKEGASIVKGALSKSFTIHDAKVSEVYADIHEALFGEKP